MPAALARVRCCHNRTHQVGGGLRLAALERDNDRIEGLTIQVEAAGNLRAYLREAIRQHESATHKSRADAAEAAFSGS
jgi:hypothetical protein